MAEESGSASDLPGIFQGAAGAAICGLCAVGTPYFWHMIFGSDPPPWAKDSVPNVVGAAVIGGLLVVGGARLAKRRPRHKTAAAKGDRLAIYVAQLDGDDARGTLRRSVIDTIVGELGRNAVEVVPAGVEFRLQDNLSDDDAGLYATKEGRKLLRKRGGICLFGAERTVRHSESKLNCALCLMPSPPPKALVLL